MGNLKFRQIHLDFHTSELIPDIGSQLDLDEFGKTLSEAGVDSINRFGKYRLTLNYQPDTQRYVLHFPHYIPEPRSCDADLIEDVIPLHQVQVRVRLPIQPRRVYLAPEDKSLNFTHEKGYVCLVVVKVEGYQMVVME